MAPRSSRTMISAGLAAGVLAAPFTFLGPAAPAALRDAEKTSRAGAVAAAATPTQPPMAGIVGPSLVGAAVVTAALSSLSTRAAKKSPTTTMRAEAAVEEMEPPPPKYDPSQEMGIGPGPIGFFDPLGFSKDKDEAGFRKLRSAELKHGRVAMMASIGAIGQHWIRFPIFESANGTFKAAVTPSGFGGTVLLFASCSLLELAWRESPDSRWAGDYGDPFGVNMMSEDMRNKEVNNGRMAMISCLAIFAAEMVSGKDAMQQFGFGPANFGAVAAVALDAAVPVPVSL